MNERAQRRREKIAVLTVLGVILFFGLLMEGAAYIAQRIDDAQTRAHEEAQAAKLAAMTPQQRAALEERKRQTWAEIAKRNAEEKAAAEAKAKAEEQKRLADLHAAHLANWRSEVDEVCQAAIERQANDPDSVEFYADPAITKTKHGARVVQVIRGKNSFGALVPERVRCDAIDIADTYIATRVIFE